MDNLPQDEKVLTWSLFAIWNKALATRTDRSFTPRARIWASDLGKPYIDRYLAMTGVEPTTPPNSRSKRKFDMGAWLELYFRVLLKKAGLFQKAQEYLVVEYPGLLPVTGRLDYYAGGKPNWTRAEEYVQEWAEMTEELPDEMTGRIPRWLEISQNLVKFLKEEYGDQELKEIIIELKTCSDRVFNLLEMNRKANPHHILQLFHYLKGKPLQEGHLLYVSKDDGRAMEFGVFNPSPVEDFYKADIEQMTYYYNNKIQPDLEKLILFNPNTGTFSKNWKVEYSSYLYYLYNFETPMTYREAVDTKIKRFNGLITRIVEEKTLTKQNLETEQTVREHFPDFEDLVKVAKKLKEKQMFTEDQPELERDELPI